MHIVILDGYTMNPGDLSWAPLQALGECAIYDRTTENLVIERSRGAEIVITNKVVLSQEMIGQLPTLKYIGVAATGYNVVDTEAARRAGVIVTNVPAYSAMSVAQMVFAHLLHWTHHVAEHSSSARSGKWASCEDFSYWDFPLVELNGKTMGIVGMGQIGSTVARIAQAFGMRVIFHTKGATEDPPSAARQVDLDTVFSESDIISLHCPLNEETHHLVNAERLKKTKPTAFLINTGRGPLVDEQALAAALNSDRLAGAGIDVLSNEPPAADNPLLSAKNCTITPHFAWATKAARQRLLDVVAENVKMFISGKPQNVVS